MFVINYNYSDSGDLDYGRSFLDIGLEPGRKLPSIFYQMEKTMIKNYLKMHPEVFKIFNK